MCRHGLDPAEHEWLVAADGDGFRAREEFDIGGGHAAGLRTIWLRRGRTWDPSLPPPDGIVDSLLDVLPVVLTAEDG